MPSVPFGAKTCAAQARGQYLGSWEVGVTVSQPEGFFPARAAASPAAAARPAATRRPRDGHSQQPDKKMLVLLSAG